MKKFAAVLLMLTICPCFAIDWLNMKSQKGIMFALDIDSIREIDNYYFYNLKVYSPSDEDIVVTMQSQKNHPFSSVIFKYQFLAHESTISPLSILMVSDIAFSTLSRRT